MGFKRTPEGRVFFQGTDSANDEVAQTNKRKPSNPSPQMRSPLTGEKTQGQIITLLKTLNERLKVTQADRDRMMKELDKHRTIIEDLENKAERSEKRALDLENKFESDAPKVGTASTKAAITELEKTRQALVEMERKQSAHNKALTDKVTKSASGMKALQRRIESTEAKQSVIDERIEAALSEQAKLTRKVDKAIEDRARFMRKIERIEETVIQTRDSLNAKAMVLLTEQGASAGEQINEGVAKYLPDDLEDQINEAAQKAKRVADIQAPQQGPSADTGIYARQRALPWWQNSSVTGSLAGAVAFILAVSVISILALNDWRWPYGRAADDNTPEILAQSYYSQTPQTQTREAAPPPTQSAQSIESLNWEIEQPQQEMNNTVQLPEQTPVTDDVGAVDLDDAQEVAKLIEEDPQRVAAALNNIEPQKQTPAQSDPAPAPVSETTKPTKPNPTQAKTLSSQMQRDKNLPNVIRSVEDQAFEGIGEAQHDLAAIYTAGHGGVNQDYKRAAYWFEKASENGIANASYNLGVLHHQGLGFEPDVKEAMLWYKDAASKGHPEAQYNLGIAYIEGIGVPYDPVTASNYFENAANSGVIEAAYNLGLIYENGLLGKAEPDKALLWYKTASDQGSPEAKQALTDLANTLAISTDDVNSMVDKIRPAQQSIPQPSVEKESNAAQIQQTTDFSQYSNGAADQGTIAQIQEYLMRAGLYPGPADGMSGALTQDAIRSYQSMHSMDVTGEPTQNLLGHMLANANQSAVFQSASDFVSAQ